MSAENSMKAWAVYDSACEALIIVSAGTRGKAHARVYLSCKEAGYTPKWSDFKVKRANKFDSLADNKGYDPTLGYHAKGYDFSGNYIGYDQWGCLAEERHSPDRVYKELGK